MCCQKLLKDNINTIKPPLDFIQGYLSLDMTQFFLSFTFGKLNFRNPSLLLSHNIKQTIRKTAHEENWLKSIYLTMGCLKTVHFSSFSSSHSTFALWVCTYILHLDGLPCNTPRSNCFMTFHTKKI